jgi:hypothetical protein
LGLARQFLLRQRIDFPVLNSFGGPMNNYDFNARSESLVDNLTYMFKDPNWKSKLLIGGLINLVPILGCASAGYMLEVIRNIREDKNVVLPDWSGALGNFVKEGLILSVISLIYAMPALIATWIGSALLNQYNNSASFFGSLFTLIAGIYTILLYFAWQAITVQYAITRDFSSCFNFPEIAKITFANIGRIVKVFLVSLIAVIAISILISILVFVPCVGWIGIALIYIVSIFYILLIVAYNSGFIARSVSPNRQPPENRAQGTSGPSPKKDLGGWE